MAKCGETSTTTDKKRERGDNWTREEKELLIELMKESSKIVDNKNTDTNANKQKNDEWLRIEKRFRKQSGKYRSVSQLKGVWRRIKFRAKKNISQHKQLVKATGGGQRSPSSSEDDNSIQEKVDGAEPDEKSECITYVDSELDLDSMDGDIVSEKVNVANGVSDTEVTMDKTPLSTIQKKVRSQRYLKKINYDSDENMHITRKSVGEKETLKKVGSNIKNTIYEANLNVKEKSLKLLEEEYALKIKYQQMQIQYLEEYQKQELRHQIIKHNLEIDILMLEKKKKEQEIELLKRK